MNVNKTDQANKKKGWVIDADLAQRIKTRKIRLFNNDLSYRDFARTYGFKLCNVEAAIRERRTAALAKRILKIVDTLPLPGEGGGQANIRECL